MKLRWQVLLMCATAGCGQSHRLDAATADAASVDCVSLRQDHTDAFEAAVYCEPDADECTGAQQIRDVCGCVWAANDAMSAEAARERATWEALSTAGCVPTTCGSCPAEPRAFTCRRLPLGTGGTCERR